MNTETDVGFGGDGGQFTSVVKCIKSNPLCKIHFLKVFIYLTGFSSE